MIILVGEGSGELYQLNTVVGEFRIKLEMITKHASANSDSIVEVDDETYILLRPILRAASYDYAIIINVPDIPNPRSFLYEDDTQVVNVWSEELGKELIAISNGSSEMEKEKEKYEEEQITDAEEEQTATTFAKSLRSTKSLINKNVSHR